MPQIFKMPNKFLKVFNDIRDLLLFIMIGILMDLVLKKINRLKIFTAQKNDIENLKYLNKLEKN